MKIRVLSTISITAIAGILLAQPGFSQSEQKLGSVHFETSCKPEAARLFDQGMLYQHSFWYRASQMAFEGSLMKANTFPATILENSQQRIMALFLTKRSCDCQTHVLQW